MWTALIAVCTVSTLHCLAGVVSIVIGAATSISSEIWTAHAVSPIWSGAIFLATGLIGYACAKKRSRYLIMGYVSFSSLCLIVCVVSIQLLRLGLVDHTIDGEVYAKEREQHLLLIALGTAAIEIAVALVSIGVGCHAGKRAKLELGKRNEGTFTVQIMGSKEILIKTTQWPPPGAAPGVSESDAGHDEEAKLVNDGIDECEAGPSGTAVSGTAVSGTADKARHSQGSNTGGPSCSSGEAAVTELGIPRGTSPPTSRKTMAEGGPSEQDEDRGSSGSIEPVWVHDTDLSPLTTI